MQIDLAGSDFAFKLFMVLFNWNLFVYSEKLFFSKIQRYQTLVERFFLGGRPLIV